MPAVALRPPVFRLYDDLFASNRSGSANPAVRGVCSRDAAPLDTGVNGSATTSTVGQI
jgi:hypothetical protein